MFRLDRLNKRHPDPRSIQRVVDDRLDEFDYGHWSGLGADEVNQRYPEECSAWIDLTKDIPIQDRSSGLSMTDWMSSTTDIGADWAQTKLTSDIRKNVPLG